MPVAQKPRKKYTRKKIDHNDDLDTASPNVTIDDLLTQTHNQAQVSQQEH